MSEVITVPPSDRRILEFARSEMFERTFREGMGLVEETAAYLDGPGRAAAKHFDRLAALSYAGESMRLTTRLMQVASWLLVQRAVREGEMKIIDARDIKYRFTTRDAFASKIAPEDQLLPADLKMLIERCARLYDRVRRLDESMYAETPEAPSANHVGAQFARLQAAFENRGGG
jgi:regulator of CtrA degradation